MTTLLTRVLMSTAVLVLGVAPGAQETGRSRAPASILEFPFDADGGGPVVSGAPYSAVTVTEITGTLARGNGIVRRTEGAVYRDSAGRTRREGTAGRVGPRPSGPATRERRIITIDDVVAGLHYVLDPVAKTAHRMPQWNGRPGPAVPGQPADRIDPAATERRGPPSARESLGTKIIDGLEAEGTRTTVTIPAGDGGNDIPIAIVTERWVSRELQVPVLVRFVDPRVGERVYRLTGISRGEPPPQLFVVPPEFTMVDGPERLMRRNPVP